MISRRVFIGKSAAAAVAAGLALKKAPTARAGSYSDIEHIIVIMQENRGFDHYYSDLAKPEYYGNEVDVFDRTRAVPTFAVHSNVKFLHPYHITPQQPLLKDPPHLWSSMWNYYNRGDMNRFKKIGMGYITEEDIPWYYQLSNQWAISDRYFSSVLGSTYPNRSFLLAGTSFGLTNNFTPRTWRKYNLPPARILMDECNDHGVSWGYFTDGKAFLNKLFGFGYPKRSIASFHNALATDTLPSVCFVDAILGKTDEHPKGLPQDGMNWVRERVEAVQASPVWEKCAIFITYDEAGGFYDHVPPPTTVKPDNLEYGLNRTSRSKGRNFERLGFRVPLIVVSPYAKQHYVSHIVADHTSILRFICDRFGIVPMGNRAKVAHNLMDMFNFTA